MLMLMLTCLFNYLSIKFLVVLCYHVILSFTPVFWQIVLELFALYIVYVESD